MFQAHRKGLVTAAVVIAVLLVVVGVALLLAGHYFFSYAMDSDANISFLDEDWVPEPSQWMQDACEEVWMESADGLRLHAWYAPKEGSHRYVLICHGYGNEAVGMAKPAEQFFDLGYSVLMPDARAHGKSEGRYIGMGWPERRDVVAWAKQIVQQDPEAQIALYGVSMGGATVMMASGEEDLPKQVVCVVEDCGYSSVWDEFAWQLKQMYKLPPTPIMQATSLVTRFKSGFWLGEASAVEQLKKSSIPTLFIHGDQDDFVPFSMLEEVYSAAGGEKEKLVIPGAAHANARKTDPELYWSTVEGFLTRYMAEE